MTTRHQYRARSRRTARWATERTSSRVLARHLGVSDSRARHQRAEGTDPITQVCALVRDPLADGPAIVCAILEAFEDRGFDACRADRAKLQARLRHLVEEAEHLAQAKQDRALMVKEGVFDAVLHHASVLIEIAALRCTLGMEG